MDPAAVEKPSAPNAAEILNRIITTGLIEKKPSTVRLQCSALRRVIRRLEAE